uniref:Uncharacterized protein n=1 Tax=Rhizophora mucronata TaxID=61149 RepID=A0A2P2L637_RHIMU
MGMMKRISHQNRMEFSLLARPRERFCHHPHHLSRKISLILEKSRCQLLLEQKRMIYLWEMVLTILFLERTRVKAQYQRIWKSLLETRKKFLISVDLHMAWSHHLGLLSHGKTQMDMMSCKHKHWLVATRESGRSTSMLSNWCILNSISSKQHKLMACKQVQTFHRIHAL